MARARFEADLAREPAGKPPLEEGRGKPSPQAGGMMAMQMIPIIIELSRHSPSMVTALGVSIGFAARAILPKGTIAQKERWASRTDDARRVATARVCSDGSRA